MARTRFLLSVMSILLVLKVQCYSMAAAKTNIHTDQSSLVALKSYITSDPKNILANTWSNSTFVCNWTGVTCGLHRNHLRVEALNLSFMSLVGTVPPHLGNLTFLVNLTAINNSFHGNLPNELSHLSKLKTIDFGFNNLTGEIPSWLGSLPRLARLYLYGNQFTGSIPTPICNLTSVEEIKLYYNQLSGSIPKDIRNLILLKILDLSNNNIKGAIPKEIGNLQNLEILILEFNSISGVVPPALFNSSTIRRISLIGNKLSGGIPSTLGLLAPNLEHLLIEDNFFSGMIPKSISNASKLTELDLSYNHFSGFIPSTLGSLRNLEWLNLAVNNLTIESTTSMISLLSTASFRNLEYLDLGDNPLNVTLPASIGNLSASLEYLFLKNCNLRGSIPGNIANLSSLINLSLSENGLSGSIPKSITRLHKLQGLYLHDNKLPGSFPVELCQLQRLNTLDLSNTMLFGSIPTCLGNLTSLRWLSLAFNDLTLAIPSTFWGLTDMLDIDLSYNSLNGSLSADPLSDNYIGKLRAVKHIDVSNNQLSGNISRSIGDLQSLEYLSLKNNSFEGSIPSSFGNLIVIESLDLSMNNLSGEIPKSLEKLLNLKFLNLSSNRLYGEIPSGGPFANFSSQSFLADYNLCGASRFRVPPCKNVSRKLHVWRYILPCVSVIVVMVILVMIALLRKRKVKLDSEIALFPNQEIWRKVTHLELSRATDGFREDKLLGNGSFGSVYHGILSNGKNVAVKVFNLELEEAFTSFDTECEVLCNIRHRNLVKIITCCSNVDFKALVLEYISQGSLEKWLYFGEQFFLNILQRLNIMIDVASALEYLHYGYSTPIVHCDLKPSNVLIDEDMVAHVTDFGISKLLCGEDSITQTMTLATIGYMAPEYGLDGIVSRRGDVYSYGILLIEVFTGKKPRDEMFAEEMTLRQWVENSFPHSVPHIIDANLLRTEDRHYNQKKDLLSSIMELALACSATSPEERTDMKSILNTLNKIKKKYLMNGGRN